MDGVIHICVTWCKIRQKLCKNWGKNKYVCMYVYIYICAMCENSKQVGYRVLSLSSGKARKLYSKGGRRDPF